MHHHAENDTHTPAAYTVLLFMHPTHINQCRMLESLRSSDMIKKQMYSVSLTFPSNPLTFSLVSEEESFLLISLLFCHFPPDIFFFSLYALSFQLSSRHASSSPYPQSFYLLFFIFYPSQIHSKRERESFQKLLLASYSKDF